MLRVAHGRQALRSGVGRKYKNKHVRTGMHMVIITKAPVSHYIPDRAGSAALPLACSLSLSLSLTHTASVPG